MLRKFITVLSLLLCFSAAAQVPVEQSSHGISLISPKYFGPYAFPVPELLEGEICSDMHLEISGDYASGSLAGKDFPDRTGAATFKASFPLWTDRATLSVWGEMHEWFSDTPQTRAARRVSEQYPLKEESAGNVYFSIDMLVLKESAKRPSIALRAATQSATGDKYEMARHYDAPGYFFDISAGKSFEVGGNGSFRASATAGFVCWQIDRGTQNDALMLGAKASYRSSLMTLSAEYGQYTGLEKKKSELSGDAPKSISLEAAVHCGKISPFLCWKKGLNDWPFSIVRAGICLDLDIL